MLLLKYLLLLSSLIFYATSIQIKTSFGKLSGIDVSSDDGSFKYIFKSVPFAKPPIDGLRFEKPQKPEKWDDVRNATEYSPACMIIPKYMKHYVPKEMSEDCLYLNVFTSSNCLKSKCPVIIYYHGGGFESGSAVMFDDNFILERYVSNDIVFVIPAMRVGAFGLLYFGNDDVIAPNLAAFDAEAALKYVHQEIEHFGGDSDEVTLFGHSAGAALVLDFGLSRKIDPNAVLFQKVIALSPPQSFSDRQTLINNSIALAKHLNCYNHNIDNFLQVKDCLQRVNKTMLIKAQSYLAENGMSFNNLMKDEPFVDRSESLADWKRRCPKRDLLIGSNEHERGTEQSMELNPTKIGSFLDFENIDKVGDKFLKDHQNGVISVNSDTSNIYVSVATNSEAFSNAGGKVYLFETRQKPCSEHLTDMAYFIGIDYREFNITQDHRILDSFYSKLLVNFTRFSNPSPEWQPLELTRMNYYVLQVDLEQNLWPTMNEGYHEDIIDYWMINMTAYDRCITDQRIELERISDENQFKLTNQWWLYLLIVIIVVMIGLCVYSIKKWRKRREYQQLN